MLAHQQCEVVRSSGFRTSFGRGLSLLVIVLVAVCGGIAERARAQGGGASDRAVLVALYEATGGPQWNARRNWASGRPLERWRGVSTKRGGRVRELDLAGAGLSGELPAALGRLTELKRLDLSGNALSGEVPESMLQMTSLETLALLPQAGSGLCARSEALQAWLESLGAGLPACPGSGATGEIEGTEAGRAVVEAVRIASEAVGEVIAGIAETVAGVVGVAVAPTELRIAEGGSGSYTVALTAKPSEEVEVEVVGAAGDVSVDRATLRFAGGNWDAAQRVTVRAARDADALADEPVTLAHRVRGGGTRM